MVTDSKSAAIICAEGIGDGLLMMIVAHQLKKEGYEVTIFHNLVKELSLLFEGFNFIFHPPLISLEKDLKPFSKVIVENDHSERAYLLFSLREEGKLNNLIFFFPTPSQKQETGDFLFNKKLPVVTNIVNGCIHALHIKDADKENGLTMPANHQYRRHPKRIVIHPMSNDPKRNYLPKQFLLLAKQLQSDGFSISFIVSPRERNEWLVVVEKGFELPEFDSLKEVTNYIYESGFLIGNDSGLGHLASNLKIPTLTISGNPKRVRLWRPDWHLGQVVTIPFPLPNFKGINFRFRENFWQYFIPIKRTLKAFYELVESDKL